MRRRNYSSIWRGVALAVDPASFGTTLIDASIGNNHAESAGSGNEITPVGSVYAVKTNGSGRYVTPIVRHGIGTGNFTVSAWVIPDAVSAAWRAIWSNGNTNAPAFYTTTGGGTWGLWSGGTLNSLRTLTAGVRYHLCARRLNGVVEFWTDGIKEPTSAAFTSSLPDAVSIFFSEQSGSQAASAACCMRDFFFHSRAITEAEIRVLSTRCGIVHEMGDRHAGLGPTFNAAWIRIGSRVIGGGVF
jgi:hypothetical protein